jgi:hypothetical protein
MQKFNLKAIIKFFFLCLFSLSFVKSYSQIAFEKGYFIDKYGSRVDCYIKNKDWESNPNNFEYRFNDNDEVKVIDNMSVKEFGIDNTAKYLNESVEIDLDNENLNKLSTNKNPKLTNQVLFLKVLVEGKISLLSYQNGSLIRFFIKKDNKIEQLIFLRYLNEQNLLAKNNQFKAQLINAFDCEAFKIDKFEKLEYAKKSLIGIFAEYNKCVKSDFTDYEPQLKSNKDRFNLNFRPRLNYSSLSINNKTNYSNIQFDSKIGVGIGLESEFILPYNKGKWAIVAEPTFQSFKGEKQTVEDALQVNQIRNTISYSSIEMALGLRHYFYLKNKSQIFLNVFYAMDFGIKAKINQKSAVNSIANTLFIRTSFNFGFGLGYKFHDKIHFEMRYQPNREILVDYLFWNSNYSSLSIVLGYTLF